MNVLASTPHTSPKRPVDHSARTVQRAVANPVAVAATLALVALSQAGCKRQQDAEPPQVASRQLPSRQVPWQPRRIPLSFVMLTGPDAPNTATEYDIMHAVDFANEIYGPGMINFYVHQVRWVQTRALHRLDSAVQTLTWQDVAGDAVQIEPSLQRAPFFGTDQTSANRWLAQIASFMPRDYVTIFVATFSGENGRQSGSACNSPFPHNDNDGARKLGPGRWANDFSKGIYCVPSGNREGSKLDTLAHELGHYIGGLVHTFDVAHTSVHKATGDDYYDYYDFFYAVDPTGRDIVRFTGPEQIGDPRGLKPVDSNCTNCDTKEGTDAREVVKGSRCNVRFRFMLPGGTVVYDTDSRPDKVFGVVRQGQSGGNGGINLMSYLFSDPIRTPCHLFLTRSQFDILHRKLSGTQGHRNQLGTVSRALWSPSVPLPQR